MEDEHENPNNGGRTDPAESQCCPSELANPNNGGIRDPSEIHSSIEEIDSTCSTPYVSAPSSPGRGVHNNGYYFSAPASPMRLFLSSSSSPDLITNRSSEFEMISSGSSEFEFSARFSGIGSNSGLNQMISADELFLNGQIRPMKLSSHLQRPQALAPLLDLDLDDEEAENPKMQNQNGENRREVRLRNRSLRRRTRSLSPLRSSILETHIFRRESNEIEPDQKDETPAITPSVSASSSRSSSGRSSKRWISLKDFLLHRSKSEGSGNSKEKFWSSLTFSSSPSKEKKPTLESHQKPLAKKPNGTGKSGNAAGKRRVPPSPHEIHYTANRAQAEEMKKKTFLPYRQGLLGCLGFKSRSYTVMNGFARTLHPVSSR